jgi:bifunctional UDP-N-acetylglucosamine pyrophosphorylase/glucosamine-1-phosphate N-acetyltransferase
MFAYPLLSAKICGVYCDYFNFNLGATFRVGCVIFLLMKNFIESIKNALRIRAFKRAGVKFIGKQVYVGRDVVIESGACICSPCHITGATHICAGVQVLSYTYIDGAYIGKNSKVISSTLTACRVGESCTVGPYAYLRQNANVGDFCRVGDFVEIKNASLGKGSKVAHLAYVGDAKVGANVNIGCGVVFANFNGKAKHMSQVDDDCFIGCNCNIVAPVHVKRGAYIAAGTTLCTDLEEGDFCIGRCRERIIFGGGKGRYLNG